MRLPALYAILDERHLPEDPYATVNELAEAGVALLQLRAKQARPEEVVRRAGRMRAAAPAGMTLILNDYPELLGASGFHGLHLGQADLPIHEARAMHPHAILGLSTHTPEQVRAGQASAADYLAVGPIFATTSKADAEPAVGLQVLRQARALTEKPLVAIGGITLANVEKVWAAGADSAAILSALWQPGSSPGGAARDFQRLFRYNNV